MTRKLGAFALGIVAAGSLHAQTHEWKQATSGGYTYRYVTNDPAKARFYTLQNGLTVILSPTPKDPRIQCYIAVKAGSKTDPATNTGLAHYLEHMVFKGTSKYGTLDWAKEKPELDKIDALYETYNKTTDSAQRIAIYRQIDSVSGVASKYSIANEYDKMMSAMGAQGTNAFTSVEQTVYTDDVPSSSLDKYLAVQGERFRDPILRIFHTELEAVYEEKNRGLDNDGRKVFEALYAALYQNHNYGKQTTIGTVEHLKNPSLVEIRNYYKKYYVPNNMGVIMSGDFNPDVAIKKIDQAFGYMKNTPVDKYSFTPEAPITAPVVKEVMGPDAESVTIGYRLPNNKDKDMILADIVGTILSNGKAGLIDLNLVKKQKLLSAFAGANSMIDYGFLMLRGTATTGQNLDEVKDLLLGQVEELKRGNFDNDLLTSIVNNEKKSTIYKYEKYSSRASMLMDAFTSERDWLEDVDYTDIISKVTKADIVAFANKYFGDNYVAIYKRKGEDKSIQKIVKPTITAVTTNADKQSDFVKKVNAMPSIAAKPVFLDYNKDIQRSKVGNAEVLMVPNKDNSIYRLRYRYKMGTLNDKKIGLAASYLQFLGTDKMSAEQVSKEFYKIATNFNVQPGEEYTTVYLEGLNDNFDKAVKLYEDLIANIKPDAQALQALKARIAKQRKDAKANKGAIMSGLTSYAMYGPQNKFNNVLSNAEIDAVTPEELVAQLQNLRNYQHQVLYYGPLPIGTLVSKLKALHKQPATWAQPAAAKTFTQTNQTANKVLFTDYDMVQSETRWVRNLSKFDAASLPMVTVFNNYFGGGMGSLVFQTIRESKALAYSTAATLQTPSKKEDRFSMIGYVGSQSDKFNEAVSALNELYNTMPELPDNFQLAKDQVKKDIETERITQDDIIFTYLADQRLGLNTDRRINIYNNVDKITIPQLKAYHNEQVARKPFTYVVVASDKRLKEDDLKAKGELQKLTLEEVFGY